MSSTRSEQARRTRRAILDAAVAVAVHRGFAALRITDVAAGADVSVGLVHYHFATREALLVAALRHAAEADLVATDAATASGAGALERLDRFLTAYAPEPGRAGWRLWIDAWGRGLRSPAMARITAELEAAWHDRLVTIIEAGGAEGVLRCSDPAHAATRILALATGLAVQTTVHTTRAPAHALALLRAFAAQDLDLADRAVGP